MEPPKENPKREVVKTMIQLATTGFGVVAALAWNDAITTLFKTVFGEQSGIISRFVYAIFITVIIVLITHSLGRLAERTGVAKKNEEKR